MAAPDRSSPIVKQLALGLKGAITGNGLTAVAVVPKKRLVRND